MGKLLFWGIVGCACFSSSFVLYELMSVQGGHWLWSAALRCMFMGLLLTVVLLIKNGFKKDYIIELTQFLWEYLPFWVIAGSIGFGTYGLLAFAADYAAGWVVAATFLFTVVAGLFVLFAFGQRFSPKIIVYCVLVFIGVVLANVGEGLRHQVLAHEEMAARDWRTMVIFGALPAFLASFCFPIGNQLIWQAGKPDRPTTGVFRFLPTISSPLIDNPLHKVWLMSVGSLPLWAVLVMIVRPPAPSGSQVMGSFLVALIAGVIGTSIFLYARTLAKTSTQIAAVDATQGTEIIFALIGGMLLLHTPIPSVLSMIGIFLVILGLVLFAKK